MAWKQLRSPNLAQQADAGMCLFFARSAFGAPPVEPSAWRGWEVAKYKHGVDEALPNVMVPLWFTHYGTYGTPPAYKNWGHVVIWVPGRGYLSSPGVGYGQKWLKTIAEVESYFHCKYVGWTEDISGVRVAENLSTITPSKEETQMIFVRKPSGWIGAVFPDTLVVGLANPAEYAIAQKVAKAGDGSTVAVTDAEMKSFEAFRSRKKTEAKKWA